MPKRTHGISHPRKRTKLYRTWMQARNRCRNPNHKSYSYYGGRGITFSTEWETFEAFRRGVGDPPSANSTLDRIDNTRGYEPGNCRWTTRLMQARNRAYTRANEFTFLYIMYLHFIECLTQKEIASMLGFSQPHISKALRDFGVFAK